MELEKVYVSGAITHSRGEMRNRDSQAARTFARRAPRNQQRSALVEMHREGAASTLRQLHESPEGKGLPMRVLRIAGLNREAMMKFGLGYAPSSGDALLRFLKQKYPETLLEVSGLLSREQNGRFFDRFRPPHHVSHS